MALRGYHLGCPGWGLRSWVGRLFPAGTRAPEFLARYAEVFNTVEGNTTFYALPTADTVARWRDQVPATFRFCFKFPRAITHDRLLIDGADEVRTFLDRVLPLGERLGTLMLQLPPRFGPPQLDQLARFLDALPPGLAYAVELRDDRFFAGGPEDVAAIALLRARGVDLVIMDTRGIHTSTSLEHAAVRDRKPNLPVVMRATGTRPLVRFVPHERFEASERVLAPWIPQLAAWIAAGHTPYVFVHSPDDIDAPANAYQVHARLRALVDVGELPPWPGTPRQLELF